MLNDIFSFWNGIAPNEHVHPADCALLTRVNHHFDLDGLPGSFMGPLCTAPVVLLYLAPGPWAPGDSVGRRAREVAAWHARTRAGHEPLPGPEESAPTWRWWSQRLKVFGDWEKLRTRVAFLNLAAYHSPAEFKDFNLLRQIPSSNVAFNWARDVLFPAAEAKQRLVVCLRSSRYWGLQVGQRYNGYLFAPRCTRGGHMHHGESREAIANAAKTMVRR